jgi:hypothetical protein
LSDRVLDAVLVLDLMMIHTATSDGTSFAATMILSGSILSSRGGPSRLAMSP